MYSKPTRPSGISARAAMSESPEIAATRMRCESAQVSPWFTYAERARSAYVNQGLTWALSHRILVAAISGLSLIAALALIPLGLVGFEYIPPVDRGQIYVTLTFPPGTPLETTRRALLAVENAIDETPDVKAESAMAGAYLGQLSGYIKNAAIAQMNVFLRDRRSHTTAYWADEF